MYDKDYYKRWYERNKKALAQRRKGKYRMSNRLRRRMAFNATLHSKFNAVARRVAHGDVRIKWKDFARLLGPYQAYRLRDLLGREPTLKEYLTVHRLVLEKGRGLSVQEVLHIFEGR